MLLQRKIAALALLGFLALSAANAAPLPEPKAVTADESKWLLGNAEMFVKFNIKQMMASDLMTKGGTGKLKDAIKNNEQLKAVLEATEIDVTKDVDSILASGSGTTPKDSKVLLVIRGKFNQGKIHDTLKKAAEKEEKLKLVKEGTTQLYEIQNQDKAMYAAFADRNTIVMTQSKDATVDAVKNGGKNAAAINKNLQAALGKFTGKESVAMAMVVNQDLKKMLEKVPNVGAAVSKIQVVNASITLTDAVAVNLAGETGEAKSAKQIANVLDALKALGAGMEGLPEVVADVLNATKITATKEAVKIDLKLSKEMIDKAAKSGGN